MYNVQNITGKGIGLIATQNIPRGTRILSDNVLISINAPNYDIVGSAYALSLQARQTLLDLSRNTRKHGSAWSWFESIWLSKSQPRSMRMNHDIINVFRNNNFDIGSGLRAVFPAAARINHACVPNAQGNFNTSLNKFTIHATHDIQDGEELSISYLEDQLALKTSRQEILLDRYGFGCMCAACTASDRVAKASEGRRIEIRDKLSQLAQQSSRDGALDPVAELAMMERMLEVYELEGIRGREASSL